MQAYEQKWFSCRHSPAFRRPIVFVYIHLVHHEDQ